MVTVIRISTNWRLAVVVALVCVRPSPASAQLASEAQVRAEVEAGAYERAEQLARARVLELTPRLGQSAPEVRAGEQLLVETLILNGRGAQRTTLDLARRLAQPTVDGGLPPVPVRSGPRPRARRRGGIRRIGQGSDRGLERSAEPGEFGPGRSRRRSAPSGACAGLRRPFGRGPHVTAAKPRVSPRPRCRGPAGGHAARGGVGASAEQGTTPPPAWPSARCSAFANRHRTIPGMPTRSACLAFNCGSKGTF